MHSNNETLPRNTPLPCKFQVDDSVVSGGKPGVIIGVFFRSEGNYVKDDDRVVVFYQIRFDNGRVREVFSGDVDYLTPPVDRQIQDDGAVSSDEQQQCQ